MCMCVYLCDNIIEVEKTAYVDVLVPMGGASFVYASLDSNMYVCLYSYTEVIEAIKTVCDHVLVPMEHVSSTYVVLIRFVHVFIYLCIPAKMHTTLAQVHTKVNTYM